MPRHPVRKPTTLGPSLTGRLIAVATSLVFLAVAMLASPAQAVDVPPPGVDLFLQTSGPSAGLNIGDWYTTPVGSGGGGIGHEYAIDVPASWPSGTPITVALFDPESFDAGVAHTPAAADEVRSSVSDQTTFTLRSPAGAVLQTTVFSSSATDGQWYQLYTFDPGVSGYGQYTLETTTGDNNVSGVAGNDDDNSWRLNVNYDPDCSTGTTGSCVGLVSGNETDNPDGLAGTGDELYAGINRGSFQHAGTTSVCNDYYFFVGPGTPRNGPTGGVLAHNFDMDSNGTVTYTDPNGTTYGGSVSGNATWNNSATSTRVGDELPAIEGWWTAEICLTPNNQYIFEGPSGSTTYLEFQPQTPDIQLVKNDGGLTEVDRGDTVTYTIDFANVSDLSANPGQAFGLQIVDVIPAGVTYVASSCAIGAPQTGTCSYDVGSREVTFTIDGPVDPGEAGQVSFQVTVDVDATGTIDNNATAVFADSIGNLHSSTSNVDSNTVAGADLFVQKVVDTNNPVQGATIAFTVTVSNLGGSDATNVVIRDILPAGLAYVSSSSSQGSYFVGSGLWSVGSLASGVTQSLTITADVTGTGTITNVASVAASDQADPDAVNNESSVDVTVTVPDLTVAKTSDATGSVGAGDTIAYTVTITNSGTTTQTGITIDDLLPAQVAYVPQSTVAVGTRSTTTTANRTVRDEFSAVSYGNNNGTVNWTGNWVETNETTSPTAGRITIASNQLRFANLDSRMISRSANLSNPNIQSAVLTFNYVATSIGNETLAAQMWNGSSWVTVASVSGGTGTITHTLSAAQISAGTAVRFASGSGSWGNNEAASVDNVQIAWIEQTSSYSPVTLDNLPGGVNSDLLEGNPATGALVVGGDGLVLRPGESMTVTYRASVSATLDGTVTQVVNTVSVSSTQQPQPSPATLRIPIDFQPALAITKSGPASAAVGDTVTYTFVVSHGVGSDGSPVSGLVVSDDVAGVAAGVDVAPADGFNDGDANVNGLLDGSESWTYSASYTVQASDPNPLVNVVSVSGVDTDGGGVGPVSDSHSLDLGFDPVLAVVKSGPPSAVVGESVAYSFVVSHGVGSDGSPVSVGSVVDDVAGPAAYVSGDDGDGLLESSESWTYQVSYVVLASDPDPLVNTVSVSGSDGDGDPWVVSDSHSLDVDSQPVLSVAKSGLAVAGVGQSVTYSFVVSHAPTSDGSPVSAVSVSDDVAGPGTYVSGDDGDGVVELGESWTYTATYTVDGTESSPLVNTVTVSGTDVDGDPVSVTDTHSLDIDFSPVLAVVKSGPVSAVVGQSVTYSFVVSHAPTSDGSPVSAVSVSDDVAGPGTYVSGDTNTNNELDSTESWTYTASYVVLVSDPNQLTNTVTVSGSDPGGGSVVAQDDHVTNVEFLPVLEVVKTGPATAVVGQTVTFTFAVSHAPSSDGSPLVLLTVTDDVTGTAVFVSGDTDGDGQVDGSETWLFSDSYTIQASDPDVLTNTATAQAADRDGDTISTIGSHDTDIEFAPVLEVVKSGPVSAVVGDTVAYTFVVSHRAGSDGSPVSVGAVSDDVAGPGTFVSGDTNTNSLLDASESWTYTASYVVQVSDSDPLTNTVTVTGTDTDGDAVAAGTDTHDLAIDFQPAIAVTKSGPATAVVGDTVTYTFAVSHGAGSDGSGVTVGAVSDDVAGVAAYVSGDDGDGLLELGESWQFEATHTVVVSDPDPLTNTVTVTGTDLDGDPVAAATDTHDLAIDFQPAIAVTKSGPATAVVGDTVTYTFVVTNDSVAGDGSPVTVGAVSDDVAGVASGVDVAPADGFNDGDTNLNGLLELGESWQFEATHTVVVSDPDPLTNTVTVTGTDLDGDPVAAATDTHDLAIDFQPAIAVTKSGPATAVVGDTVTYTFVVTNDSVAGDGSPVTVGAVSDDVAGVASGVDVAPADGFNDGDTNLNGLLELGESWQFEATHTVVVSDPDPLTNTVTVTGTDLDGDPVAAATDTHDLAIDFQPAIAVTKSGPAMAVVGDTVTYTFVVSHGVGSDGSPVSGLVVSDDVAGVAAGVDVAPADGFNDGDANVNGLLDGSESWTYSASYTVQASDPNPLVNVVSVSGVDADGGGVGPVTDSHSLNLDFVPVLSVVKSGPVSALVGELVSYSFVVSHDLSSDGSGVTVVSVTDDVAGPASGVDVAPADGFNDGDTNLNGLLDGGESWAFTASRVVLGSDPDPLVNTVVVSGTDGDGDPVSATDVHSVDVDFQPVVGVVKSGLAVAGVGQSVTYTFEVTNDAVAGDGSPVSGVSVSDDVAGVATYVSGDDGDGLLEAGESWIYTASHTVLVSDPSPLVNTVTVSGVDADGDAVSATDAHSVTVDYSPVLQVVKSGPVSAAVGDTVGYTFVVSHAPTSDGSVVSGLSVSDDVAGPAVGVDVAPADGFNDGDTNLNDLLEMGESWTFTASYTVLVSDPNQLTNTVTASGSDPGGGPVVAQDAHTTDIDFVPVLQVAKTGPATAVVGQTVNYTFEVSHAPSSDRSPLVLLTVTDDVAGVATYVSGDDGDGRVEWGETWTFSASYTIKASDPNLLTNTGTAQAADRDGDTISTTGQHTTDIEFSPIITVTKSGPVSAVVGDTVTYTFAVSHGAGSDGSGVTVGAVSDDVAGVAAYVSGDDGDGLLESGESWQFEATHTVVVSDPDPLTNTVTVTGTDLDGDPVAAATDTHDLAIDFQPAIAVTKSGPATAVVGDTVTYTFVVTNDSVAGDGSPVTVGAVSDDVAGVASGVDVAPADGFNDGDTNLNGLLELGESWQFEATHTVVVSDPDPLTNTVTVTGTDLDGDPVAAATDTHDLAIDFQPAIAVTKSGPATAVVGDTVTYTFVVTNDSVAGDGSPVTVGAVSDDVAGVASGVDVAPADGFNDGDTNLNGLLELGESWQFEATHTVVVSDPDPLTNTVTVTGTDLDGDPVAAATDTHDLAIDFQPAIAVTKSGPATALVGETVTYGISVSHGIGSDGSPILEIDVDDFYGPPVYVGGDTNSDGVLQSTETWSYTVDYTILASDPDPFVNTAEVSGVDLNNDDVGPSSDTHSLDVIPSGTVTETVFEDVDADGVYTSGVDNPLAGVDVTFTDVNGVSQTLASGLNGIASVLVEVGSTSIDVVDATLPVGLVLVSGSDPTTVTAVAGSDVADETGYALSGTVTETVFEDVDADGVYTSGVDTPLVGVDVTFTDVYGVSRTVATDVNGEASVTVPVGSTSIDVVEATLPVGLVLVSGSDPTTVTAVAGSDVADETGYALSGTVTETVFEDVDADGVYTSGVDAPLVGVDVTFTDVYGVSRTVATDVNGEASVTVPVGSTSIDVVEATLPVGLVLVSGSDPTTVTAVAGSDVADETGYALSGTVTETVFEDVDADGVFTSGTDAPLVGVDVTFTDVYGVSRTVATDVNGEASVTVPVGSTSIDVVDATLPAGATLVAGSDPTTVTAVAGSDVADETGYDFVGTVTETVFEDVDADGGYTSGVDAPLVGVDVTFTDSEGNVTTVTTDVNGVATATVQPGAVDIDVVDATLPAGATLVVGSDPTSVTAVAGADVTDETGYDFVGTVTETVFEDVDADGVFTSGTDAPLVGVDVTFTDSEGNVTTVTTDINGEATATVQPGDVDIDVVDATLPVGLVLVSGSDPTTVTAVAGSDVADETGYALSGTVTETVFEDVDADGVYTSGVDTPLVGVDVTFTDVYGVSRTVATDVNGEASVTVPVGSTSIDVVEATLPVGLVLVSGSDPTTVTAVAGSDVADETGYALSGTVTETVFEDVDADGVFTSGTDAPLVGVDVTFTDVYGVSRTVATDVNGEASVTVPVGSTSIDVVDATLPAGATLVAGTDPTTVTAVAGSDVADETGYALSGTVTETLFEDVNGDGAFTSGTDTPLVGVGVTFTDSLGTVTTVTTDVNGEATATVQPGAVDIDVVDATLPAGATLVAGTDPTTVTAVAAANVSDETGYDFVGTVSETVFEDVNGDGVYSFGIDVPLVGVSVTFSDSEGNVTTLATDPNGVATATVQPGAVTIDVVDATLPAGATRVAGTDPTIVSAVAGADVADETGYDFVGTVTETVFEDVNADGAYTPGTDAPLVGVDVTFTDSEGNVTTLATDTNGVASATVQPGSVTVDVVDATLPAGATRIAGTDPTIVSAVAGADVTDATGYDLLGASSIAISKTALTPTVVSGGDATFEITVTNTGEEPLSNVVITDPQVPGCDASIATFAAGEFQTYTCTLSGVTADFTNTIGVTADDPLGNAIISGDNATVVVLQPSIDLEKDPAAQSIPINGTALFTITIGNPGETDLTNVVVSDPQTPGCDATFASLAIGATVSYSCGLSPVAANFTNTASVTADDPIGNQVTATDSADVTVLVPGISVTKDPAAQFVRLGATATFSISVTNTGASSLTNIQVTDVLAPDCDRVFATLASGATESYSCTYTPVTGDFTNTVEVSGTDGAGNVVTASDVADVDMINPSISLTKDPATQYVRSGDTASFTLTITNTGDSDLTNVSVSDAAAPDCAATFPTLASGGVETITCELAGVAAGFTNTADVSADTVDGGQVTDTDSADVIVISPSVGVTKDPATQNILSGQDATFTITINNLGDSDLVNVSVTDPNVPSCNATFGVIPVAGFETITCTALGVTAGFTNTVTVVADDLSGQSVTASDTADVVILSGAIDIQKTPNLQVIPAGSTATFGITVSNAGPVDLFNVVVSDAAASDCDATFATLAVGATETYGCTLASVPADFINSATVTAADGAGNPVSDSDTATVDTIAPSISISKTPDVQTIPEGGTASFTMTVTNTGDADLTAVSVTDLAVPDCDTTFAGLVIGETRTYTCTEPGVFANFTNIADVSASDPLGATVTDTDTADVTVLLPGIEVQKTPDYQQVGLGGTATFTITVTNTGSLDLTNIAVTDPAVPACDFSLATLAVGDTHTSTCAIAGVNADFTNTVDVTADAPFTAVSDTDTADVDVVTPVIEIQKTPALQTLLSGETASFTVTVTNSGDIDVTNVTVSDPNAPGCDAAIATLAAGTSQAVSCSVANVTADFVNTATVTVANPLGGPDLTDSASAVVDVVDPGVAISKTPDIQQVLVGEDAVFTITVVNTGDQDLVGLSVTDTATPACDNTLASIPVGGSATYTCTAVGVTADFVNIVSVSGTDTLANPVSGSDEAFVDVISPVVAIGKTPDLQQVPVGGDATFNISVTNTGDVDLTAVSVVDPVAPACDSTIGFLAVGTTSTYTCALAVTADLTNTATVSATDPLGNVITADDTADVEVLVPGIEIQKTPDLQLVLAGDAATFTITVTNTGETALTNVSVVDPAAPTCNATFPTLGVGETRTVTCGVVAAVDFVNTANVTASDPVGATLSDSDTAAVDVIAPALSIAKTPDLQAVPLGGDAMFTIEVTNTGDVDLTSVTVSDPAAPGCDATIASLAAGATETYTCTVSSVITPFTNTASVSALDPAANPVDGGSDTADVTVLMPGVSIDKSPDSQAIGIGQDAAFTVTVTNTGQVDLAIVDVVDPAAPACASAIGPLAVGASASYSCTVTDILTPFTNTATVVATDSYGNVVGGSATADVLLLPAQLTITKAADSPQVVSGGDVTFTILVDNNGPADVVNVSVTDPGYPGCDASFALIAAGGFESYTCVVPGVTADFANTVAVAAEDEAGGPVNDSDTETVTVLDPQISVFKTPDTQTITEGDDAVFTITVINTGETDLTSVTVVDALSPACDTTIAALAVGEFQTYSCTLASVGSSFTNSIDVSATDSIGGIWTASDTADVIVLPTGVIDGFVFEDVDGDGAYTAGVDQPIVSVDVLLSLADGSLLVVATQADGTWTAVVPVGDTSANVDETDPDFPGGLVESTGTDGQTITVVDTSTTSTAPVGYAPTAQLSGTVFEDTDGDGLQTGEPGVGGVVVRLWEDVDGNGTPDVLVSTTATGGGGDYLFADLAPGDYLVEVLPPGGMDLTFQDQGADDGLDSDVSPATGLSDIRSLDFGEAGDIDAGVYTPVVLGDTVFFDVDRDGLQGAGEPGVGGVMVTATSAGPDGSFGTADDRSVSTTTDSSGLYSLGVPPGLVGVEVAEPAGTMVTTGNDGSVLAVVSGDIVDTVDFGVDADATLSGSVVLDANSDGTLDPADAGLSGVALTATWAGPDGVFGTADDFEFATTTASDGTYLFVGLPPGAYSVTIDRAGLPAGTVDSFDRDGTADGTTSVTLAANELVPDADFGVIGTGDLSVVMFHDIDGDGVLDAGEPALVAVSVTGSWAGPDGVFGTSDDVEYSTVTDGSGLARLSNLPAGSFVVAVDETTLPAGMVQTADPDSILDSTTSAPLGAGESVDAGRFGYRGSGAIGDTVFFDLDHDGIQDVGEPGVAGVDVIVIWAGADGVFGTADDVTYRATTDSAGQYLVSGLPTGSYRASVDPATTPDGSGAPGQSFLLGAGQTYLDADFGIGSNNPPEAVDDSAETLEDTAVTVIVLANDTDPEGHALVVTIVTDPGNGSVVVNPDGSITYRPDPDFWGADTFTYTVCEAPGTIGPIPPEGLCDVAGVVVTVTPVNDAPVLVSPTVITGVVGSTLPPLAFQDAENDPFSVVLASGALPAGVSLLLDGTFSGVPTQAGTYVFSITVCDNAVPAACSTVLLTMVIATGAVSGGSQIPYTGINSQSQLLLAVLLVLAGAAFVVLARRRRSRPSETGTQDRRPAPSGSKRVSAVPPSPGPTGPRRVGHGPAVVPFESDEG